MKINQYISGTAWRWLDMSRNMYLWFGLSNNIELCFIATFLVSKQYEVQILLSTLLFVPHCHHVTTPHNLMLRHQRCWEANCFNLFGRWEWHIPQKFATLYGVITQEIIARIYSAIKALYPIHQSPWNLYSELCIICCTVFAYVSF